MSLSQKYGRTYHYSFSPGTTSDDRIRFDYWEDMSSIKEVIHTEKLDGENTCLNKYGVFARSHVAPTAHPWAGYLKQKWEIIKYDLGDLEFFGENLYAIHSIRYIELPEHFFVFGIREKDRWLSWEETCFYSSLLDFPVVPVLKKVCPLDRKAFENEILALVKKPGVFGTEDVVTESPCTMEGIVTRNMGGYSTSSFMHNVFKYVRKGHVKTTEHWARNWKRAPLNWEKSR
ncbi:RNA ligase family protein [Cytophagaceae bacterium ABcell3]|nr:RNA ligase family protein [Cytophagaceae bacterium ABcell3]